MSRELPLETRMLLAAEGVLTRTGGARDDHLSVLRSLVKQDLTPGADPAWRVLRGAADAFVSKEGRERYELAGEIDRLFRAAVVLARKAPKPEAWRPKYTGGGVRDAQGRL